MSLYPSSARHEHTVSSCLKRKFSNASWRQTTTEQDPEITVPYCLKRRLSNAPWQQRKIEEDPERWRTAAYMTIVSGHDLVHVLEALVVGMALKKTSTRRRICFVNDVPPEMELLLHTV